MPSTSTVARRRPLGEKAAVLKASSDGRAARRLPVATSHNVVCWASKEATVLPSGEKVTPQSSPGSWRRVASSLPVAASQKRNPRPGPPETSVLPSGEKAAWLAGPKRRSSLGPAGTSGGRAAGCGSKGNPTRAAGIDVHSDNHVVCVGPGQVCTFGAYTADLHAIAAYLRQAGVTTVALESTGVYWIPLFEHLEAQGFACYLVEPGQLHGCGARPQTDVRDCQWLQRLPTYGLLKASFRPPQAVRAWRADHRQRPLVLRSAAAPVQHLQKALGRMNVKLTEVLSDITGVSGRRIIRAIPDGERDPHRLAGLASPKCAKARDAFALALRGLWQPEHRFELRQGHALFTT